MNDAPYQEPAPPRAHSPGRKPLLFAGAALGLVIFASLVVFTPNPSTPKRAAPIPKTAQEGDASDFNYQQLRADAARAQQQERREAAFRSKAGYPANPSDDQPVPLLENDPYDARPGRNLAPAQPALAESQGLLPGEAARAQSPRPPPVPSANPLAAPLEVRVGRSTGSPSQGFSGVPTAGYDLPPLPDLGSLLAPLQALQGEQRSSTPSAPDTAATRNTRFLRDASTAPLPTEPRTGSLLLPAGTIIPATLVTRMISDLPGSVLAFTSRDVLDARGRAVLVPKGSRLFGSYNADTDFGQQRAFFVWTQLLTPAGRRFDLTLPGTDPAGASGIRDKSSQHLTRAFGSAVLLSILSAGAQLSQPNSSYRTGSAAAPSAGEIAGGALGQQLVGLGTRIAERYLDMRPTLEIRTGTALAVMVTHDLYLPPAKFL